MSPLFRLCGLYMSSGISHPTMFDGPADAVIVKCNTPISHSITIKPLRWSEQDWSSHYNAMFSWGTSCHGIYAEVILTCTTLLWTHNTNKPAATSAPWWQWLPLICILFDPKKKKKNSLTRAYGVYQAYNFPRSLSDYNAPEEAQSFQLNWIYQYRCIYYILAV